MKYSIVGEGNLIGPQVYITANGAVYILFGFGKKQGWFLLLLPKLYVIGSLLGDRAKARELLIPALSLLPIVGAACCPHPLQVINFAFPCCLL